jgi:cobaltochelatase CobN
MKLVAIMWSSYLPLLKTAAADLGIEVAGYSNKQLNSRPEMMDAVLRDLAAADLALFYRTSDDFWEELESRVKDAEVVTPRVVVGPDPSYWAFSTVGMNVAATAHQYVLHNGRVNLRNLLRFLSARVFGVEETYALPEDVPWEGIFHPEMEREFSSVSEYLAEYERRRGGPPRQYAGVLYSRSSWIAGNLDVERALISSLENAGVGVIPVFYYSIKDTGLGNLSGVEAIEKFMFEDGRLAVDAIVKLSSFFLANARGPFQETQAPGGVALLKRLNVPLLCPVISYQKTEEEWEADPQGLGSQVSWSIAMPEFEGAIEPVIIGATAGFKAGEDEAYLAIRERADKLVARLLRWLELRKKPNSEKRVAFILNNNPCAAVEATVGGGAHLDTLESVARVLAAMRDAGYSVDVPASGKAIIDEIMGRKAISEFRWTPVEEIVSKGGAIARVSTDLYSQWFQELPARTRERLTGAWGNPPGEPKDGIPAAMVFENQIVVTGVRYGNALVAVQPKRGCAGARCDGQVCKILHDPDVPPPHQYVATYKWISREFRADAIVHVGTHGNLEFLPGKSTGLSSACLPDIGIDTLPHLYIYNADNPPEGAIAKRRSYATLVDHMQTVMIPGELYGDLEQLEKLLEEYARYKSVEPGKAHSIAHMIAERVKSLNLLDGQEEITHQNVERQVQTIHEKLSLLKGTYIPKGMHIFGSRPEGESLADFLYAILRFETGPDSLRGCVAACLERERGLTGDALKEETDRTARAAVREAIATGTSLTLALAPGRHLDPAEEAALEAIDRKMQELRGRVAESGEIEALLNGFRGGYIEAGPSGLITRGRGDVLPTGRNFYTLDPGKIPSLAAWAIGQDLARKTVDKHRAEEGNYPENIAFYWQCTDIMWADGEGMAQMLYLIGVRPVWQANGRVRSFEVIPLPELGRPRIDITVRVSGITRDNFPNTIDFLDEAVQAVARLDEPVEENFVRKHSLERMGDHCQRDADAWRQATYRIFASMPGTYQAGTQLAVYASAWKTDQDLSDVFLYWNGYAYGKGVFGTPAHSHLQASLKSVDVTFNKTATDEYDLTGCCCYFGTHGGLVNAARVVSGNEIKNYYGDTRDQGEVSVRTLTEEIRRIARAKILNPAWIAGMKEHGYKGAAEISKRVGRLYGWQATAKAVDGSVFDDAARTFMMNEENRRFFEENNPWALEEMARRLIEAAERGLWTPAPDVREALKNIYVEIEGWIEERMGDVEGEFQGGSIDIVTSEEVESWKKRMQEVLG